MEKSNHPGGLQTKTEFEREKIKCRINARKI